MNFNSPSKGEQKIIQILKANNIDFKREVTFSDLTNSNGVPLRFDFGIYRNNRLVVLIEYDGEPHFKYVRHFHKNKFNFLKAQERDRRKNSYCLLKKLPLIRIPYWDYDILTLNRLLTFEDYRVKSKYHNDFLINGGANQWK